jgi:glycerophosphoryl diester phosphodiesterase
MCADSSLIRWFAAKFSLKMQFVFSNSPDRLLRGIVSALFLSMSSLLHADVPLVIAHRGASAIAPENTASSIREAIRLGAKVIEFDVRVTLDGELVLFHDKELDRVAGRPGTIEESDWAAIQTFDVGKWFQKGDFAGEKIILFSESIRLCLEGGATPLIEHKTGSAEAYAAVVRELEAGEKVIVQSFDWEFLTQFKALMPGVRIGALGSKELSAEKIERLRVLRPDWVGWSFSDLKEAEVPVLHGLNSKIALWTVNDPEVAKKLVAAGVDAIITDVPDVISAAK